ncbi:MAG: hypothetical protein ACYCZF_03335 [Anaerolineae bacterium]
MSRIVVFLLLIALLAGCLPVTRSVSTTTPIDNGPTGTVVSPVTNPYAPQPGDDQLTRGKAYIESSEIYTLESYPPQFRLALSGSLPTPCHQLRILLPVLAANGRLSIDVYSVAKSDQVCAQVLKPFTATLSLDGHPAGTYNIWVNGAKVGDIVVPPPLEGRSMKGWEIYSWQVDGVWYYALLVGTNRNKTLEEVQDPAVRLESIEMLKERLSQLAEGEWVTWLVLDYGGLELPPQSVQDEMLAWAEEQGLNLQGAGY